MLCDDEEIDKRIFKTTQLFGMLRRNMMASKDTWPEVKRQTFVGMIIPTLLDGAEHWVIGEAKRQELNVAFNSMVRSALRFTTCVTRKCKCRITNEETHKKLGLENLDYYFDQRVLGHAGHVERMADVRLPKLLRDSYLERKQKRGRPLKTHQDQLLQCMKRKGINVESWKAMASDRATWRSAIRAPSVYDAK
jgi:hypothetical protein